MKIQLLSDIHCEFQAYDYPESECDIVVLAGDVHTKTNGVQWAVDHIKDKPVLYIAGNHEFYGKAYPKVYRELRDAASGTNVHILEKDVLTIDGINFLACTLWTDFKLQGDPRLAGSYCQSVMTDYKKIRRLPGYSRLRSIDTAIAHQESLFWLDNALQKRAGQKNIVITHHAPSSRSISDYDSEDLTHSAYASNVEGLISRHDIDYWLHGHCHSSSNYFIGNTNVLCNPRGYPKADELNVEFDPDFIVEI